MAINNTVLSVRREGADLVLTTERYGAEHLPSEIIILRDATIEPKPGDFLHFGGAGTQMPDGSWQGGGGFIAMDGNEFPYQRISHNELIQAWSSCPDPTRLRKSIDKNTKFLRALLESEAGR